jgi:predicted transcriptional regulator YdeE
MSEAQLTMTEFGPVRVIGVSYVGKNQNKEIPQVWEKLVLPRRAEVTRLDSAGAFGICRCKPGATDGSFEYIAGFEATPTAKLPGGMIEASIPRCQYVVFDVPSLAGLGEAWQRISAELPKLAGWETYCGPKGCHCDQAASFEYYPPSFAQDGKLQIYIPVRKA